MSSFDNIESKALQHHLRVAFVIIAVNHCIGLLGLNSTFYHALFEKISFLNLLLSFILVMIFHRPFDLRLFIFCVFAFMVGMAAEIAGVNTAYIFGSYHYTPPFGWQVMGVPLIIGINWILLSYVCGVVVAGLFQRVLLRIISAGILMVWIDLLLERFAIRHHFWVWESSVPPLSNYVSWFCISIIIQIGYIALIPYSRNPLAPYYLAILLLFLSGDMLISFCR